MTIKLMTVWGPQIFEGENIKSLIIETDGKGIVFDSKPLPNGNTQFTLQEETNDNK